MKCSPRQGRPEGREERIAGGGYAVRFLSSHVKDAISNATRFVKEGGAEVVKIEGGEKRAELIRQITDAEIPVAATRSDASVGQCDGRLKVQGKNLSGIEQLMRDAVALDRAGVACLIWKAFPAKWPP